MVLEFDTISVQTIIPSSPTPSNHQYFKLSLLDQIAPFLYTPIVLFYSADQQPRLRSDRLKKSLAQTLTKFYPLAGRISEHGFTVECKSEGAEYFEARVGSHMAHVISRPDAKVLQQLLPYANIPSLGCTPPSFLPLLGVKVNYFQCGGIAIGACVLHKLGDASTLGAFLVSCAAAARGSFSGTGCCITDCTRLFPPVLDTAMSSRFARKTCIDEAIAPRSMTKLFVFDGRKIKTLRKEITRNASIIQPVSRVLAVSAFIWGSIIRALYSDDLENKPNTNHVARHVMNLRNRLDPPLPENFIGSICQLGFGAKWPVDRDIHYGSLAKELQDAINKLDNESNSRSA